MNRFIVPAEARSWVEVDAESHFPIQNLPFGRAAAHDRTMTVSRIGDFVVDLSKLGINVDLSRATPENLSSARRALYELLVTDATPQPDSLLPIEAVEMLLPIRPGCFVDFYSGIHHASNVGMMFRPDQPPLLPNYRWLPIGYNGRASTVVVSGTEIIRPKGQTKGPNDEAPQFGPTKELDFELEMGFYTGLSTPMGATIGVDEAEDYMLGLVLVNDWSARDVQRFEYQPLGPFLAKSFATSVSPWIVTLDALEPFRTAGISQDPAPLDHLRSAKNQAFDIQLEVTLETASGSNVKISQSNTNNLYWSFAQQLSHQASNGTVIEHGDLYASGTISGDQPGSFGSMLELSWRGSKPISVGDEMRTFLLDGDEVTMSAFAQGDGFRVGFGEVSGRVVAAR